MNRIILRNFSSKRNTWCYRQGYYQYNNPSFINNKLKEKDKKNYFSYGKWFEASDKPLNRIKRQVKIKEFLNQYY